MPGLRPACAKKGWGEGHKREREGGGKKRVVSVMHVLAYCTHNKCDNTSKLLHYLRRTNFGTLFFPKFRFFFQPPLLSVILLLMRNSQWGSDAGLFWACQISYRKMKRSKFVWFAFLYLPSTQNLRFRPLNPKLWLTEVSSVWLLTKQNFQDVILWSHIVKVMDTKKKNIA